MLPIVAHFSGEGNTPGAFLTFFPMRGQKKGGDLTASPKEGWFFSRIGEASALPPRKIAAGTLVQGRQRKQPAAAAPAEKEKDPEGRSRWQREKDSNPHIQSQSLLCYPYTIPLCFTTKDIIHNWWEKSSAEEKIFLFLFGSLCGTIE